MKEKEWKVSHDEAYLIRYLIRGCTPRTWLVKAKVEDLSRKVDRGLGGG